MESTTCPRTVLCSGTTENRQICPGESGSEQGANCYCATNYQHHHYHEIRQNAANSPPEANLTSQSNSDQPQFCDTSEPNLFMACDCCGNLSAKPNFVVSPNHRHHHHPPPTRLPRDSEINRIMSSTENLQTSSDDTGNSRRKKPLIICKQEIKPVIKTDDVSSLDSKVGIPVATNIIDNNSTKYSNQIEIYNEEISNDGRDKIEGTTNSEDDQGPPLPPRPPPRPRNNPNNDSVAPHVSTGVRKYVVWCLICGGAGSMLGILFLGVYFLIRSYTSSVAYFETVPTFVPATLLILTGLCVMSLARRRNRYSFLIKLSGACGLASALTCALTTVTTTAIHMSRLQGLKECEYQAKTKTCTCYTIIVDSNTESIDESMRFVFDSTTDCGVVNGSLYSCLRALFGLSVVGVLVAVFSCMLVYQLLSHERKKMYWEQLELRCRSLYTGQQQGLPTVTGGPTIIETPRHGMPPCRCCEQCHSHGLMPSSATFPWHTADSGIRFWTPGNFYSPNPGGDEMTAMGGRMGMGGLRNARVQSGWSWPRMPWQRNEPQQQRFRQPTTPSSPDSQYGFSNNQGMMISGDQAVTPNGGYTVIGNAPYGVWGPPPPYSDPNSPARRNGRYQYIQCQNNAQMQNDHHQQQQQHRNDPTDQSVAILECHEQSSINQPNSSTEGPYSIETHQTPINTPRNFVKRHDGKHHVKNTSDCYENLPSDSDNTVRCSNTLPFRKTKKRVEIGAKSIGPHQPAPSRVNVQQIFNQSDHPNKVEKTELRQSESSSIKDAQPSCVDGLQKESESMLHNILEPTESEVYFADVSSCCNTSVKHDSYYDDTNRSKIDEEKDYLAQRFGNRESSVRSRLPFPQNNIEENLTGKLIPPAVQPRTSLMNKDISRQSMCSMDSEPKTDFTDLSPTTPVLSMNVTEYQNNFAEQKQQIGNNFVASFPYSSNEQSQEAHRRPTQKIMPDVFSHETSPQYEIIPENSQKFKNNFHMHHPIHNHPIAYHHSQTPSNSGANNNINNVSNNVIKSPKNLNITPIKRQNVGTNISTIIQNLGGSDVLYPESENVNLVNSESSSSDQTYGFGSAGNKTAHMLSTRLGTSEFQSPEPSDRL